MKLIATVRGQALQLYRMDDVRPIRKEPFLPDLFGAIVGRYQFKGFPQALPKPGEVIKFETGKAVVNGEAIAINVLDVYNDGVIVNTGHTDDSDAVLDDLFGWLIQDFGFREPSMRRRYVSQVIVELNNSLDKIVGPFSALQRAFASAYEEATGERRDFHAAQFAMAVDPTNIAQSLFRIEVRENASFPERRYFCVAPIPTTELIELMNEVERALAAT
jgi:hypothetical protein